MSKKTSLLIISVIALMASFTFAEEESANQNGCKASDRLNIENVEGVDYYQIGSCSDLYKFAEMVNNDKDMTGINGKLTADITVNTDVLGSDGNYSGTEPANKWTPIGSETNPYTGTFDGDGHAISGLYVNGSSNNVGLFGYAKGTIKNLEVVDSYFKGRQNVAGIAGYCYTCTIEGVHNGAAVNGDLYIAGIVGLLHGSSEKLDGIWTFTSGFVRNSYNTGNISGSDHVGGVVGCFEDGNVEKSYNAGYVHGSQKVGGIIGGSYGREMISNCFNVGKVESGYDYVGGIVGFIETSNVTVSNCYNAGDVIRTSNVKPVYAGCIAGSNYNGCSPKFSNTYYLNDESKCKYNAVKNGAYSGVTGKTVAELANIMETGTFDNTIWTPGAYGNEGGWKLELMPALIGVGSQQGVASVDPNATSVEISTETQLFLFAEAVNAGKENLNAELKNSITLTSAWNPIGTSEHPYRGTFNGNNHVISKAKVGSSVKIQTGPNKGFFGFTDGATIQNVGFVGSDVRGFSVVGGVVANATSTTLSNVFRQGYVDCHSSKSDTDGCFAGGLIGISEGSSIVNSYNVGAVYSESTEFGNSANRFAGGLVGKALAKGTKKTSITTSFSVGQVKGKPGKCLVGEVCENQIEVSGSYYDSDYCADSSVGDPLSTSKFAGGTLPQNFDSEIWSAGSMVVDGSGWIFKLPYLNSFTENGQQSFTGSVEVALKDKEIYVKKNLTVDDVEFAVFSLDSKLTIYSEHKLNTIERNLVFSKDNDLSTNPANVKGTFYDVPFTLDLSKKKIFVPNDEGVYEIGDDQQLKLFAQVVNTVDNAVKGKLMADIDLEGSVDDQWTPMGSEANPYAGTFDGDGHTIKNLYFDNSSATYVGLFGAVAAGAKVEKVGLVDSYISASDYVGAIAGTMKVPSAIAIVLAP